MKDEKQVTMLAAMVATMASGIAALVGLATLAYVVSPIDAIPDFIPVAGQADDAGAITFLVALLYGMQKSGVLAMVMQVWREVIGDVNKTIDKAIEEVTK